MQNFMKYVKLTENDGIKPHFAVLPLRIAISVYASNSGVMHLYFSHPYQ